MSIAKTLHIRLFLEGVEVPVVSASVQANPNSPAVASIQVVPLDEATQLRPRTMVHLFFYQSKEWEASPSSDFLDEDTLRKRYRLLFTGEVVGFSFVRTPASRAVILQCVDFSSYWDACHTTSVEWGPNGNAFHDDSFLTASNSHLFDNIVNQQPNVILGWLGQKPQTTGLTGVSGLAGGVIRMLEAVGGVVGHAKGVNDFFTVAELRAKILAQIAAEENDSTARRLMDRQVFQQWLSNGLQNASLQSSFRDLLKLLFQYIFYDVAPNPAARYLGPKQGSKQRLTSVLKQTPVGQSVKKTIALCKKDILSRREMDAGTLTGDDTLASAQLLLVNLKAVVEKLEKLPAKAVSPVIQKIKAARRILALFLDSPSMAVKVRTENIDKVVKNLDEALEAIEASKVVITSTLTTDASMSRLLTQIIRPDCFFAAPPRCNVIFPEHYVQLAYDRSYLTEVTRLHLLVFNQLVGYDRLFADSIIVPSLNKDYVVQTGGPAGYRSLMKHELHVGINPRTDRLPDSTAGAGVDKASAQELAGSRTSWGKKAALFTFFKYRLAERVVNLSGRFNPNVVCGFPGLVLTAPTVVSDISRSATASEPNAGLGSDKFAELLKEHSPMQLVGMVGAVSHSIDQNGGTTTVMMHHVRQHDGKDDEFLNIQVDESREVSRFVSYVLSPSARGGDNKILSELTPSDATSVGERRAAYGNLNFFVKGASGDVRVEKKKSDGTTSFETVTGSKVQVQSSSAEDAKAPEGTQYGYIKGVSAAKVLLPKGDLKRTAGSKGKYGNPIHAVQVLDPLISTTEDGFKVFEKVRVFEEVKIRVTVKKPVEDLLRPAWISPSYTNENIGEKIYQPFFGCDSIVDELSYYWPDEGVDLVSGEDGVIDLDGPKQKSGLSDDRIRKVLKEFVKKMSEKAAAASIEKATNHLSYVYGQVREKGGDVNQFIENYVDRPIATMEEVLGSADLSLEVASDGKVSVREGRLGFHTLSVHPDVVSKERPLAGLLFDPDLQAPRLGGGGQAKSIPKGYDVRWEKREAVMSYVNALSKRKAFIG